MDTQPGSFVGTRVNGKGRQRGFFEVGIGLALFALFSLTASVLLPEERSGPERQVASCAATPAAAGDSQPGCDKDA